ncbi:biotin/lipoyl-binding carrier protein [Nocardioides mangrovicus]|uniref:Biotin/lipoyl-binding carrier protein n=1 Tax=Nocardioides mangrovicus TaxID=2478913 RepID=A0A3L8NZF1_9ACTN|nr:biotin/lipoyl-binding carrier protein [Nocardioides mangrovicus]RLV48161.1 biotin/lipoyl-binding carrier protein [Nocardioides mangrovicus]
MAAKTLSIISELVASVAGVSVAVGDEVPAGEQVALLESMKMEIPVLAEQAGRVQEVKVAAGDVVQEGDVLVVLLLAD